MSVARVNNLPGTLTNKAILIVVSLSNRLQSKPHSFIFT